MQFFKKYFKLDEKTPSQQGEYTVLCPFDHKDKHGNMYKETNPSAHINEGRSLFHCKSCGEGISEPSFVSRVEGISYREALSFIHQLEKANPENWQNKVDHLVNSPKVLKLLEDMGIGITTTELLRLGFSGSGIDFPVFVYGELLDVRTYNPTGTPKVRSRTGAKNLIMPFDLWREDERPTLLCAGEKDMSIARELDFNAITFTGGEMSFPRLFKYSFKDRKVYIFYDNDQAGKDGAMKAAYELEQAGAIPHIVTGHHEVATESGGDLWDYVMKYGKKASDIQHLIDTAERVSVQQQETIKNTVYPLVPIEKASEGRFVNQRFVRSRVSVISVFEDMFSVPEYVRAVKTEDDDGLMEKGDVKEWMLEESNLEDILYLMDSNITEVKRNAALRILLRIPKDEINVSLQIMSSTNVWKSVVTDVLGVATDDVKSTELLIFSIGERLLAGKKYDLKYKPVTHPLDGMRVVGTTQEAEDIDSDVQKFEVTEEIKQSLSVFQLQPGESITDKMEELYERSKGFIGVEARREVTWATDLFYHTPLEFQIGKRIERAYLDAMIVGDPRTMKSRTAKAMQEMYELGTVTSLKTATIAGLIGGSDNVGGKGWKTKIGLLPQSHRGAVIMEEFSGGGRDTISKLTEIRSSNRVRITRVNGTTDVPAMVRMLSISNPATSGGISHTLKDYPTGVHIILDLVGASEDIARYDFFLLVDEPEGYTSPLDMFDLDPFEKDAYLQRIRWIWSRSAAQVDLPRSIVQYIVDKSTELNSLYDSHIKLFGAEAWKKVSRIAIATAGLVVSTDATYERIIVKEQHVDFAVQFLKSIYDNSLFKLKEYVDNERSYSICRDEDIHTLQGIYNTHAGMLEQMAISTELTQRQLQVISGLEQSDFAKVVGDLGASRFIKWQGDKIIPTGKFRQSMTRMKGMYLKKASER